MSTVNRVNSKNIVIVKGAFDVMASRCIAGNLEKSAQANEKMSRDALRVLAVGYREIKHIPVSPTTEELENGLTFMGLVGMIDPPRPEAKAAVQVCQKAGIRPVMITGDVIHVIRLDPAFLKPVFKRAVPDSGAGSCHGVFQSLRPDQAPPLIFYKI